MPILVNSVPVVGTANVLWLRRVTITNNQLRLEEACPSDQTFLVMNKDVLVTKYIDLGKNATAKAAVDGVIAQLAILTGKSTKFINAIVSVPDPVSKWSIRVNYVANPDKTPNVYTNNDLYPVITNTPALAAAYGGIIAVLNAAING